MGILMDSTRETGGQVRLLSSCSLGIGHGIRVNGLGGGGTSLGEGGLTVFAPADGRRGPVQSVAESVSLCQKGFTRHSAGLSSAPRTLLLLDGPVLCFQGWPSAPACALCLHLCIVPSPAPVSQGSLGLGQALWSHSSQQPTSEMTVKLWLDGGVECLMTPPPPQP